MVKYSDIKAVYEEQRSFLKDNKSLKREALASLPTNNANHALVISGIRRCGKSTLMRQRMGMNTEDAFYLNFDTPKLFRFDIQDFEMLDEIIIQSGKHHLYFDEIQVVEGWELYIRQKLDQKYDVCITGSNASLLSKELGTKLTGRHISKELFPFSYTEYLQYKSLGADANSFFSYMNEGGFPEYVRSGNEEVLASLFDDILYRDIAVRYGVRDVRSLKALLLYLAGNFGNQTSANKLAGIVGVKSSKTISEYLSFFEEAYLVHQVEKFAWSLKAQMVNPKKTYFIDTALAKAVTVSFSENKGHLLENMVYWELRRHYKEIHYFYENNSECDFVVHKEETPVMLIQVCHTLSGDNQQREINGLCEAMRFFNIDKGFIVTMDQTDKTRIDEGWIEIVPAFDFVSKL